MFSAPKNPEFRKPHAVIIRTDSHIERGVIKPGIELLTSADFSVQMIKNGDEVQSMAQGRILSDWRRLYSDVRLPLLGDSVFIGGDLQAGESSLSTDSGQLIRVGAQVGKSGLGNPALVVIDGIRYEVINRFAWQNGILDHYKYYVVRVPNEQL